MPASDTNLLRKTFFVSGIASQHSINFNHLADGMLQSLFFSTKHSFFFFFAGNQSHVGQELDVDFKSLKTSPTALAVDYLSG